MAELIRARPPRSTAVALLQAKGLPVEHIWDEHLENFFYIGSDASPTALVGLELFGVDFPLRSLVVGMHARSRGLGSGLSRHAEKYAAKRRPFDLPANCHNGSILQAPGL